MKRHIASFAVLVLGLTVATGAIAQDAKKKAKARKLFDEGVAALEQHEYKGALASFEEAYAASPHWMVLAHIGTCQSKLNEPVKAINALEKYLEEGGEDIDPEERKAARTLITEQRKKVGVLNLVVKEKGAEAKIDGESIGKAPFERTLVKSGPHHIIVIIGEDEFEKDIDVIAEQEMTVRIPEEEGAAAAVAPAPEPEPKPEPAVEEPLPPAEEPPPPEEEPAPEPEETPEEAPAASVPNGPSIPFWVALGAAGAGLVTGGVGWGFFIYYNQSEQNYASNISDPRFDEYTWEVTCGSGYIEHVNNNYEDYFCETESGRRDYADMRSTALIPAIVGTGVFALGGALAVLFYFYPEWFGAGEGEPAAFNVLPLVGPDQSGLMLNASF